MKKTVLLAYILVLLSSGTIGKFVGADIVGVKMAQAGAPDFTLTDIDGNTFSLSDYYDKVVLLDFFATHCIPSVQQFSHLKILHEEFGEELVIMSISPENETVLGDFREGQGIEWTIARDDSNVFDTYNVSYTPTLVVIDQQGYLSYRHVGLTEESVLTPEIESLLPKMIVAVYGSTPTIDGSISVGEWDDAESVSFNNTGVFVKQDGENLYIAFNVSDTTLDWDEAVAVFVDVDHDEGFSYQPDDIVLAVWRNGTFGEACPANETSTTNVTDWTASVHLTPEVWEAEFNITYPKINVTAGLEKTLGYLFYSVDMNATTKIFYTYPHQPDDIVYNPSKWGDMTSTGYNWIPEFPTWTPMLLLLVVLTVTTAIYKRRLLNTPFR